MSKVLCMAIDHAKASFYVLVPIFATMLNGTICLKCNFFDALGVLRLLGNSHTLSPDCRF